MGMKYFLMLNVAKKLNAWLKKQQVLANDTDYKILKSDDLILCSLFTDYPISSIFQCVHLL